MDNDRGEKETTGFWEDETWTQKGCALFPALPECSPGAIRFLLHAVLVKQL